MSATPPQDPISPKDKMGEFIKKNPLKKGKKVVDPRIAYEEKENKPKGEEEAADVGPEESKSESSDEKSGHVKDRVRELERRS